MIPARQYWRLFQIKRILLRHGLHELLDALHLTGGLRPLLWLYPAYWRRSFDKPLAVRIKEALIELGPIFVKFGQALSTRRDLLPVDVADELATLQDRVPPYPGEEAQRIVEDDLGEPVAELFAHFETEAMASASIAQVHAARLHSGEEVVVKVLRPNVHALIRRDVDVLYVLAGLARRYVRESYRLRPVEVVAEFDRILHGELDMLREAGNAAQLKRNAESHGLLYVPEVYFDYCGQHCLVMERIHGLPVSRVDEMKAAGTDMKLLSERAVKIFFTQVFKDNFFHADMHPGNIFVDITDPKDPQWLGVDFGIVGSLTPSDQHYLAANFVAFFKRDYKRVAELHIESGWVPPHVRVDEFETAIRTVCEPIFNKPLAEISFGQLLMRLFQVARRFDMVVQPQLVLLQKTLLNIEGLGRQLYPELDLWETAAPFLEDWTRDQVGARGVFERLRGQLPGMTELMQELPPLLHRIARNAADGELIIEVRDPAIAAMRADMAREAVSRWWTLTGAALVVGGALLYALDAQPLWLAMGGLITGGIALLVGRWKLRVPHNG